MEISDVQILDKSSIFKYLDQLINIEKETSKLLGIAYGNPWNEENFIMDRRGKFSFSVFLSIKEKVLGYVIISQWLNNIHSHRLGILPNINSNEKIEITKLLYGRIKTFSLEKKINVLTAIVPETNLSTIRFYSREGWLVMNNNQLGNFIKNREMNAHIEEDNILVDDIITEGDPFRSKVLFYKYKNS